MPASSRAEQIRQFRPSPSRRSEPRRKERGSLSREEATDSRLGESRSRREPGLQLRSLRLPTPPPQVLGSAMKAALAVLAALAVFARSASAADQTISFNNNNLGSPRLVTFCPFFSHPFLGGTGVRNGVADGASYVAQLFHVVGGTEIAIGATANFRAATTTSPGTWSGGTRTAVGVPQGTPMNLKVKAWDAAFPTYEAAWAAGKAVGQSATFSFQDVMSDPPGAADNFMVNFQGFAIGCIPEPQTVVLGLLGCAAVLWLPCRQAR